MIRLYFLAIQGLCGYSRGFPGERSLNNSGVIENIDFQCFGSCILETLGNNTNIRLDCRIVVLNTIHWDHY